MEHLKLMMVLAGCRPAGRNTEQHDVFFGIGNSVKDLIPDLKKFWPAAQNSMHLDAWRTVTLADGYAVTVVPKQAGETTNEVVLFFINLGGYKPGVFEEFHYKMIVAAIDKKEALKKAKATAFYQHTGFKTAPAHVDDKFGIDVDDLFEVEDILPPEFKNKYRLQLTPASAISGDELYLGYMPLHTL